MISKTNHFDLHVGVVFHHASDGFDFVHLLVADLPLVNTVLHREGQSVVVELVGLDLVDDVLQAVGSGAVDLVALVGEGVGELLLELSDTVLQFLLLVAVVSNLLLEGGHLAVEGAEVVLREHALLRSNGLVSLGQTEVVHVTQAGISMNHGKVR